MLRCMRYAPDGPEPALSRPRDLVQDALLLQQPQVLEGDAVLAVQLLGEAVRRERAPLGIGRRASWFLKIMSF